MKFPLFLILGMIFFGQQSAKADDLSDYLLSQISSVEFLEDSYEENYQAFIVTEGEYQVVNFEGMKEMSELMQDGWEQEITEFRVLSRADSDYFTTASFEYKAELTLGNTTVNTSVTGHTVLIKTESGWLTVFDAQSM